MAAGTAPKKDGKQETEVVDKHSSPKPTRVLEEGEGGKDAS